MRAAVYDRFGPPEVLRTRQVAEPSAGRGTARVRVQAAALNPKDVLLRRGRMRWLVRAPLPRVPGYDVAGELLDEADGLSPGTPVFGMIQSNAGGACADIAVLRHGEVARKPEAIDMVEAASLPLAGMTALQGLRDELGVRPGQTVLLNGASGGVGTLAVQIAKALGATVIAVCSRRNAQLVRELGADSVVDYTSERLTDQRGLDHVFDIFGSLPWPTARSMLRPEGRYCTTIPRPGSVVRGVLRRAGLHRASLVVVRSRRRDLEQLARWVEEGRLRPVVDRVFPLERTAEAHAHLETRRARGKVVVTLAPASRASRNPGGLESPAQA